MSQYLHLHIRHAHRLEAPEAPEAPEAAPTTTPSEVLRLKYMAFGRTRTALHLLSNEKLTNAFIPYIDDLAVRCYLG